MKRFSVSFILIAAMSLPFGSPVSAVDEPPTTVPVSIEMGPPDDESVAWWREIGRVSPVGDVMIGSPGDLVVVAQRLVAMGSICPQDPDGPCREVGWHSVDGITWTEAPIPGVEYVADMTSRPDGSLAIAVGQTREGRGDRGAIWSTSDGIEWVSDQAPPGREVEWVATSDDAVVVASGAHLWASTDRTTWRRVAGPGDMPVAFGPGGFLAWGGGGQDLMSPTELWHSADGLDWTSVRLPKGLRKGHDTYGGIQVFALDDRWVLVPDAAKLPRSIFVSRDGLRWRSAPRPPGMTLDYVWWMDRVGKHTQAFGWLPDLRGQPSGMWTWRLGRRVGPPDRLRGARIGRPIEWQGERIALGEAGRYGSALTLWRWEPPSAETQLLAGVRLDLVGTCAPLRVDLPEAASAGIECHPPSEDVERVRVYLFDTQRELLDSYQARLAVEGIRLGAESVGCPWGGGPEGPYIPTPPAKGFDAAEREACFVDEVGQARYLATEPPFVLLELTGEGHDTAAVAMWAWLGNQDQPGAPTIWREFPVGPEK